VRSSGSANNRVTLASYRPDGSTPATNLPFSSGDGIDRRDAENAEKEDDR
jgi:hypothetical protein